METNEHDDLIKIVNSSGFSFQVAVSDCIERSSNRHHWDLDSIEHKWSHALLKKAGYIDIICSHKSYIFTLLIECKRMKETSWIFLSPQDHNPNQSILSSFTTYTGEKPESESHDKIRKSACWWDDYCFMPASFESSFCIIKGQDKSKPMLEHIADDLLPAIEAIGLEQIRYNLDKSYRGDFRLFLPLIVTNARLLRCSYTESDISLDSGEHEGTGTKFEEVNWIRFRKSLISHFKSEKQIDLTLSNDKVTLRDSSKASNRTILVVNSKHLDELLTSLFLSEDDYNWNFSHQVNGALSKFHRQSKYSPKTTDDLAN